MLSMSARGAVCLPRLVPKLDHSDSGSRTFHTTMKRPLALLSAVLLIGAARIALAQAPASGEPTRVELSGTIGKVVRGGIEVSADSLREVAEGEKKAKTKAKAAPAKSATAE